ncbi:unnamed protein product [Gadus morhua 'NCC']
MSPLTDIQSLTFSKELCSDPSQIPLNSTIMRIMSCGVHPRADLSRPGLRSERRAEEVLRRDLLLNLSMPRGGAERMEGRGDGALGVLVPSSLLCGGGRVRDGLPLGPPAVLQWKCEEQQNIHR